MGHHRVRHASAVGTGDVRSMQWSDRDRRGRTCRQLAVAGLLFLGLSCLAHPSAWGDIQQAPGQPYPLAEIEEAAGNSQPSLAQLIDSDAADGIPHSELDRGEASDLAEGVFGALLESSAGPFANLHVEKFLSDSAALVAADSSALESAVTIGGKQAAEEEAEQAEGSLLLEATLPLRTEDDSGEERVVDLDLEPSEGELQATNPLVEVGIPDELGEGVSIPSGSVTLETGEAAAERTPSLLGGNVAFYPNVATDTDFAVAPTPTGIETFTQLRSADAPLSQTLQLDLIAGAQLEAEEEGGAVATTDGEEVLEVMPPTAIDANGKSVPVSLGVTEDSLSLDVSPGASAEFPILVDPVIIESWPWNEKNQTTGMDNGNGSGTGDWRSWRNTLAYGADNHVPWATAPSPLTSNLPGLTLTSGWQSSVAVGAQANWNYYVPRYFSDFEKYGTRPTSFIQNMQVWNLQYHAYSSQSSPWMAVGLWDEKLSKWVSVYSRNGTEGSITSKYWTLLYNFPNPEYIQSAKNAGVGLLSSEAGANNGRILYVGYAAISLNDLIKPAIGEFYGPKQWVNDFPTEPITVLVSDTGIGVSKLTAEPQGISSPPVWQATNPGCAGTASEPCPRTFTFTGGSYGKVGNGGGLTKGAFYNPTVLPQGINYVKVTAEDIVGNKSSSALVQVKVDHTAPTLGLSGTMTNQASLGASRPQYVLHLSAADGTTASPQSGIASTKVTVDGKQVDATSAGCGTQNCAVSRDWTLKSDSYEPGQHEVVVTAIDGAGLTTTKILTINIARDTSSPTLKTEGNLRSAPDGWVEQVSRTISAYAEDENGYGLTSLVFSIDGKVVKSFSQTCADGGCQGKLSGSVDMATYTGGAHSAEVVATDGAGNTAKEAWTVNVNPSGVVPSSEAAETLEAVDETSDSSVVAATSEVVDPAEIDEGNDPALVAEGSNLTSQGTGAQSSMTTDAGSGFTISPGQESFHIEPTQSTTSEASIEITNGAAGVAANTSPTVDSVIRPIYDGVMTFQNIRAGSAPEVYSWKVQLHENQELKEIDEQHAGVFYPDGTLALTVNTEIAHDATGKEVPTSLGVEGNNVLNLTVEHQNSGFVYPVTAGPTWQTGYETIIVPGPPTKQEEEEEQAALERSLRESAIYAWISAPEPTGKGDESDASASSVPTYRQRYHFEQCEEHTWPVPGCSVWEQEIKGFFYYNYRYAWWKKDQQGPQCPHDTGPGYDIDTEFCGWAGPNHQKYGGGYHITSQVFFDVSLLFQPLTFAHAMTVRMFGSGGVYVHKDETCICNPST